MKSTLPVTMAGNDLDKMSFNPFYLMLAVFINHFAWANKI